MRLTKETIEFQHLELVKEMRRISNIRIRDLRVLAGLDACVASYSFGRQAGHTDASIQVALDDYRRNESTMIVVHNRYMEKFLADRINHFIQENELWMGGGIVVSHASEDLRLWNSNTRMKPIDHILIDGSVRDHEMGFLNKHSHVFKNVKDIVKMGC